MCTVASLVYVPLDTFLPQTPTEKGHCVSQSAAMICCVGSSPDTMLMHLGYPVLDFLPFGNQVFYIVLNVLELLGLKSFLFHAKQVAVMV
jgi:outer membrane protein assembly factor BamE (lipoprotein component of BamABCDE complex)